MREFTKPALVIIVVLSVYFPSIAVAAPALNELCAGGGQVSPGIGIGSVRLGDSLVDTVKRLGSLWRAWANRTPNAGVSDPGWYRESGPVRGNTGRERVILGTKDRGVDLMATDGTIDSAGVLSISGCSDSHSITVNTPGRAVIDAYGQPDAMRRSPTSLNLAYNSLGIWLGLKPSTEIFGPVVLISVFHPGQVCRIAGKSLCAKYTPPLT